MSYNLSVASESTSASTQKEKDLSTCPTAHLGWPPPASTEVSDTLGFTAGSGPWGLLVSQIQTHHQKRGEL